MTLPINSSIGFLKIWSFCPFRRLNSPKKQGASEARRMPGDKDQYLIILGVNFPTLYYQM